MVAVPAATPVTTPLETVATALLDVDQITVLFVALLGKIVGVNVAVLPAFKDID